MTIADKGNILPSRPYDYFFGYGSLVNTLTHSNRPISPASISGWRRAWRTLPGREIAFLTVVPDADARIEGLVAAVAPDEWATLHAREQFYDMHDVSDAVLHDMTTQARIALYAVPESRGIAPHDAAPVLLSYLDVVAQGYLDHFGPEGLDRFVATTEGWEVPFLDDRAAPLYPRAQPLADDTRSRVDDLLAGLGRVPVRR